MPSIEARSRPLWGLAIAGLAVGLVASLIGGVGPGVVGLWSFTVAAVALAFVLPLPWALVSPLFLGVAGWLVDMLPFVILAGWTAVSIRWGLGLLRERRLPRGGRWIWLPAGLVVWTALGVLVITSLDFKHFLLLLGIQVVASAAVLMVVDVLATHEARVDLVSGLVAFVVLLSVAVFLQWIGVPVESLQDSSARRRVEAAYGVDAFPNNIGMIKYARSVNAGSLELRRAVTSVADASPELPSFEVFRPKFQAYENSLVVRFEGSARAHEADLEAAGVTLLYDNVGLAPANTVPRMRSFPRNALTYAGASAALLPFAFFLAWGEDRRRRLLGRAGIVACLFGAGFSLARGAWGAIAIGAVYLLVDGPLPRPRKMQVVAAILAAAVVLTGVFLVKYKVDPLTGRAGGGASVNTRDDLYRETLGNLGGIYVLLGYGTEKPRTESGTVKEGTRYVPRAGTHSTYLNYLFRTGVPGALAILALYVLAGLHARAAARTKEGRERDLATAAAWAVVIAAAHGVILSLYVEPIYTLIVSLIVGLATAVGMSLPVSIVPFRRRRAAPA
ncbi:MAG TPA: O-antigen ligase family protein [Actinomycetota bacterium]|nr:O-antigen ligase family protein [Actinomycetota bacterium]